MLVCYVESSVTLGKFSEPQFPLLGNGDKIAYLVG